MTNSSAIILWSVPRSRSTAFERIMYERGDHLVLHEPFSRVSDFGSTLVENFECKTQEEVISAINELCLSRRVFVKDTLDFRYEAVLSDSTFLQQHKHAVMVRDPREAIASHLKLAPGASKDEMGFRYLAELASRIETVCHLYPFVIDSGKMIQDPSLMTELFCKAMSIEFIPESLAFRSPPPESWSTTGRWHTNASEATGFGTDQFKSDSATLATDSVSADRLDEYVSACAPYYTEIVERSMF